MRIVGAMVGIVAIVLLGSLFWSAIGALLSAVNGIVASSPVAALAAPTRTPEATIVVLQPTPPPPTAAPTPAPPRPTPTAPVATAEPPPPPEQTPAPTPTAGAAAEGRPPWVLLPRPEPGARVSPGSVTLEARGRGDAPIADIRLALDGTPLAVTLDQRSEAIWRAQASASVAAGRHVAQALVVDTAGRTGSYRWTFEAAPPTSYQLSAISEACSCYQ